MSAAEEKRPAAKSPKLARLLTELRRRAELRLRRTPGATVLSPAETDAVRLVHELQVHQVELEMQNDELQAARDAMEVGRDKYSDLFDFAPVGYLSLNRAGMVLEANLAAASLLGTDRSCLVGQRFATWVAAADVTGFNALLEQAFSSDVRGFCELTLAHGQPSPVVVRMEAAVGPSREECRIVLLDITSRRRAEEDRLTLNKLESAGILAGGIAHDFNNLLTVILLDIERAQMLVRSTGETVIPLMEAREAALSARNLTQQLITFAKGGAPLRKPTVMSAVIQESVRLPLSGSRTRCELSVAADLWSANVDEGQIGQVIRNLVLNAREAMPGGGVISVQAKNVVLPAGDPSSLAAGDYVRLSVADQGSGMSPEIQARIFDPYFSTKERGAAKGTGLGLTICHAIIQKHGGGIQVTSAVGVGTTIVIHLPACPRDTRKTPSIDAASATRTARILVMDDDEPVRKVLSLSLENMGHEVELAADGQQAIDAYREAKRQGRPFDLVFLDLTVRDGVGGQEAMHALRAFDPVVKGVVMSGYSDDSALCHPQQHGFTDVIVKPFDGEKLQRVVARVMGRKAAAS